MTGSVIIYFDGTMLVRVDDVPFCVPTHTLLKACAEKYGFDVERLTLSWGVKSIPFSELGIQ